MRWRTGREALFDAEHFFDGYKANPAYALACLRAAHDAGARWVVCATPMAAPCPRIGRIRPSVIAAASRRAAGHPLP
jgi:2-isopropylmalate synthase